MKKIILMAFGLVILFPGFSTLKAKDSPPDTFSFKAINSGKDVRGERFADNFTVTALGQVFWENSSNTAGSCPRLAGLLKGQLNQQELSEFATLAKESLEELEANNTEAISTPDSPSVPEWKLTYGDKVYSAPTSGGKEKVQKLEAMIFKIKDHMDASSVVYLTAKGDGKGRYDITFHLKGNSPLALVFTEKVGDTFGTLFTNWKYFQMPPNKVVLTEAAPQFKVTLNAPKKEKTKPAQFTYSNLSLADHYESKEIGDQVGFRPIKVCTQL